MDNLVKREMTTRIPVAIHRLQRLANARALRHAKSKFATQIPKPVQALPGAKPRKWRPRMIVSATNRIVVQNNDVSKSSGKPRSRSTASKELTDWNQSALTPGDKPDQSPRNTKIEETNFKKMEKQNDGDSKDRRMDPIDDIGNQSAGDQLVHSEGLMGPIATAEELTKRTPSTDGSPRNASNYSGSCDVTNSKENRDNTDHSDEGEYFRLREEIIIEADRYLEHILKQSDELYGVMEAKGRQLRHEQDLCKKATLEARLFQNKFEDERIRWNKGQKEMYVLQAKAIEKEKISEDQSRMKAKLKRLKEERDRLRDILGYTVDENTSLKRKMTRVTGTELGGETKPPIFEKVENKCIDLLKSPPKLKANRLLPELPPISGPKPVQRHGSSLGTTMEPSPPSGAAASRRLYTGKSRKEQTLKLPWIKENQKPCQKVTQLPQSDARNDNSSRSPTKLDDRLSLPRLNLHRSPVPEVVQQQLRQQVKRVQM